jgi:hypothetical protein
MQDATRNLVESRKRQMTAVEVASAEPQHNDHDSYVLQPLSPLEKEVAQEEDELKEEIEKLEEQARTEGEITEQEDEIEQAISELEEIRAKLRERRDQALRVEQQVEREASAPPAPPRKPQPRIMPPTERVEPTATPFAKKK